MKKRWVALTILAVVLAAVVIAWIAAPPFHPHYKNYGVTEGPGPAQGS